MRLPAIFRRKAVETRASGFTAQVMAAREQWISGRSGLAELTATVQGCVSLWEGAFASADVEGAPLLTRPTMALMGRALAMRGEFVALIDPDRLIPAHDWDLSTRDGIPRAYRVQIAEAGGGRATTALAAEVLHVRLGSDPYAPWSGVSPLRRARLSAEMLHAIETALAEVWSVAPVGSQVVPMPEMPGTDMGALAREFRGQRGRVLIRESVNVAAAGGPVPGHDWKPQQTTPDMQGMAPAQSLEAARGAVLMAFGVLPALFDRTAQGPLVREAQRHLALWTLAPIARLVEAEAGAKFGLPVRIDPIRPLQAWDLGGKARALGAIVDALASAKERGLSPGELAAAMRISGLE
jgi:hypothetical protein